MFYRGIVRNFKWFASNKFGAYTKDEEIKILANIDTEKAQIVIEPKQTEIEELKGYLRYIQFREFMSDKDIVEWVNK